MKAAFVCVDCHRRGDLDIMHPTNAELRRAHEQLLAIGASRPVIAGPFDIATGQSRATDTGARAAAAPTGSANDRLCAQQMAVGDDFPSSWARTRRTR